MNISFRTRVLATVFVACAICTGAAITVSRHELYKTGEVDLVEKSQAILSRLEVGRKYVAQQGGLDSIVKNAVAKYPNGALPEEEKVKILRQVPIYAAMKLGDEGSAKEHYKFRIFSDDARNKDNTPTVAEKEILARFDKDPNLAEIVEKADDGKSITVMRPVRISEAQGCLTCHGHPSKSPWGNGKDVLGYRMEDWKDNYLHGTFAIISSLEPVIAEAKEATNKILFWGIGFTAFAMALAWWFVRGPLNVVSGAIHELKEAGAQVATAAGELSGVSHGLSTTANEAAASLEETVSSLEELSSMVARNTENAKEASALSNASRQAAEKGEKEIVELMSAMTEINQSSKQMEDIINVIDDIAFQTNLLALNAAVEAARAGEQGKGFAVVAEAVRNLAQRSAEAAKEINGLIKESGERVQRGTQIADSSNAVLSEIVGSVKIVADLNNEIAVASQEQSIGLNGISQAMNQLDKVTQQNAASAEESAASSEEMSAQSATVQKMVAQLHSSISGEEWGEGSSQPAPKSKSSKGGHSGGSAKPLQFKKPTAKSSAKDVIPFDDEDDRKVGNVSGF